MKTTAKTNVKHIEQARAEVTFNGKKAVMTLDWEKPSRFYIHVRGVGVNKVIAEDFDPRAILLEWTQAMKKYGGELVARTPKQRDLVQRQRQLAANWKDAHSVAFAPSFLRLLRMAYLKDIRQGAAAPKKGSRIIHKYGDGSQIGLTVERYYPTKGDADGPLPRNLLRLLPKGGSVAIAKRTSKPPKGSTMPDHYVVYFDASKKVSGAPVDLKPAQYKRAMSYEYTEGAVQGATDWKTVAKKLLDKSKGKTQDDFHYRAYLRAVIQGVPSGHLTKKFKGAKRAMEELIDEYGKLPPGVKGAAARQAEVTKADLKGLHKQMRVIVRHLNKKDYYTGSINARDESRRALKTLEGLLKKAAAASGGKDSYKAYFDKKLKEWGIKSPADLDDAKKKKFFSEVDKGWKSEDEKTGKARDYAKEYAEYHSKPEQKKNRAKRNTARRKLGLDKGDGKEVDHKTPLSKGGGNGKKNLRAVSRKTNRQKGDRQAAGKGAAYKAYFNKKLKEWGVKSPADLDEAKKKKFFAEVDKGWKSEDEKKGSARRAATPKMKAYKSKWRKKVKGKPIKKGKLKATMHSFGERGDPIEVYDSGEKSSQNQTPIYVLLNTSNDQAMPLWPIEMLNKVLM